MSAAVPTAIEVAEVVHGPLRELGRRYLRPGVTYKHADGYGWACSDPDAPAPVEPAGRDLPHRRA